MGEEQEQKFHQLTEEPVSRVISHLAVPCIISMLVTAFYNMADTFFVGRRFLLWNIFASITMSRN